ncbi:class IV adenylate cyclase [Candidatus Woesearchaeota archaeon CG08_land_8_20_14_0_20_43_7]|nr:MAG: class IV adenylate cyclase [Candidatus Woesearchaeota archaeon CG08_land_8_20_14_0_20_43_7]
MPDEIEVKILEVSPKDVEDKLEAMGAVKVFDDVYMSKFFDTDDMSLKKQGKVLRLRWCKDHAFLTFKKIKSRTKVKIAEEIETHVKDPKIMVEILKRLGYIEYAQTKKHRVSYEIPCAHIEFDTYDDIPTFMEVEAETEEKVIEVVKQLGFKEEETFSFGTRKLFEHYGKEI